jgi:hypothetical protein
MIAVYQADRSSTAKRRRSAGAIQDAIGGDAPAASAAKPTNPAMAKA